MFSRYRVSVLQDEKVLEIYCTTMRIYLTQLTVYLKMVKMVNLMLCVFYHYKKLKSEGEIKTFLRQKENKHGVYEILL